MKNIFHFSTSSKTLARIYEDTMELITLAQSPAHKIPAMANFISQNVFKEITKPFPLSVKDNFTRILAEFFESKSQASAFFLDEEFKFLDNYVAKLVDLTSREEFPDNDEILKKLMAINNEHTQFLSHGEVGCEDEIKDRIKQELNNLIKRCFSSSVEANVTLEKLPILITDKTIYFNENIISEKKFINKLLNYGTLLNDPEIDEVIKLIRQPNFTIKGLARTGYGRNFFGHDMVDRIQKDAKLEEIANSIEFVATMSLNKP